MVVVIVEKVVNNSQIVLDIVQIIYNGQKYQHNQQISLEDQLPSQLQINLSDHQLTISIDRDNVGDKVVNQHPYQVYLQWYGVAGRLDHGIDGGQYLQIQNNRIIQSMNQLLADKNQSIQTFKNDLLEIESKIQGLETSINDCQQQQQQQQDQQCSSSFSLEQQLNRQLEKQLEKQNERLEEQSRRIVELEDKDLAEKQKQFGQLQQQIEELGCKVDAIEVEQIVKIEIENRKKEIDQLLEKQGQMIQQNRSQEKNIKYELDESLKQIMQEYIIKIEGIKQQVKNSQQWEEWEKTVNGVANRLNQEQLDQQNQYQKYVKMVEEQDLVIHNQQKQLQMQANKYEENNRTSIQQIVELKLKIQKREEEYGTIVDRLSNQKEIVDYERQLEEFRRKNQQLEIDNNRLKKENDILVIQQQENQKDMVRMQQEMNYIQSRSKVVEVSNEKYQILNNQLRKQQDIIENYQIEMYNMSQQLLKKQQENQQQNQSIFSLASQIEKYQLHIDRLLNMDRQSYISDEKSSLDQKLQQFIVEHKSEIKEKFVRLSEGLYLLGKRQVMLQVNNGELHVQLGNSTIPLLEMIRQINP